MSDDVIDTSVLIDWFVNWLSFLYNSHYVHAYVCVLCDPVTLNFDLLTE